MRMNFPKFTIEKMDYFCMGNLHYENRAKICHAVSVETDTVAYTSSEMSGRIWHRDEWEELHRTRTDVLLGGFLPSFSDK